MNDRTRNPHVLDRLANNPWTTTTRTTRTRTNRVVGMETPQRLYSSSSSSTTMDDKKRHYHHEEEEDVESSRPYRIVFLGTPEVAATTLQTLYDASLESQEQQKQQQEQQEESLSSLSKPVPQQPVPPKFFFASYEQQETIRTTPSSSLLLSESKKVPNKQSLSSSFEIVAVVTQPPKRRRKKGHAMEQSPVGKLAQLLHLPLYTPEKIPKSLNDKDNDPTMFLQELTNVLKPDLCITAAYGQYLSKLFLSIPTFGTINIHPSLLPRWRGASPIQRSLQYGDNPIGVTILYTITKMDAGPIVAQKEYHLTQNQVETSTCTTLLPLLFELGTQLLLQQLPNIWSQQMTFHTAKPQVVDVDHDDDETAAGVTLAPLIQHSNQKSEGELDLTKQTARQCHNLWRGFYEWPGVYLWIQIGGVDPATTMTMKTTTTTTSSSSSSSATTTTTDPKEEEEEDKDQELTIMESTRSNNDSSTTTRSSSTATVGTQPHRILKVKITETRVISESPTTKRDKHDDDDKEDKQEDHQQQQQQYRIRLGPTRKDGLYVTCFDGSILELVMVQPPTKRSFPGRDLQNGYPNQSLYWLSPTMARQQQQQQQQQKLQKNELLIINNNKNKETTTKEKQQQQQQQNDDDMDKKDNQKSKKKNKKKKNKNTRTK